MEKVPSAVSTSFFLESVVTQPALGSFWGLRVTTVVSQPRVLPVTQPALGSFWGLRMTTVISQPRVLFQRLLVEDDNANVGSA